MNAMLGIALFLSGAKDISLHSIRPKLCTLWTDFLFRIIS